MEKINFEDFDDIAFWEFYNEWKESSKAGKEKVITSEYQSWLIDYINVHGFIDDDVDGYYALSKEDRKNMDFVSYFVFYIEELASEQCISYQDLNEDCFGYFLLKGCIYSFETVHGQGSFNLIKKVLSKPINKKKIVIVP